jgi:hypothetical protein
MLADNQKILKEEVAVIIPVYKKNLNSTEMEHFDHNCRILRKHPLILVAPRGLDISNYSNEKNLIIEYFDPEYFESISGYNRLLLSELFYERFQRFQYILICQTDAFVFTDSVLSWCQKGFDYIGAPWINKPFFLFQYVLAKLGVFYAFKILFKNNVFRAVGNGGLSLRKVDTFKEALKQEQNIGKWRINEDFYWSFFAKFKGACLTKPGAKEASLFSIELSPSRTMKKQNSVLPFGIHAWEKIDSEYWKSYVGIALKAGHNVEDDDRTKAINNINTEL